MEDKKKYWLEGLMTPEKAQQVSKDIAAKKKQEEGLPLFGSGFIGNVVGGTGSAFLRSTGDLFNFMGLDTAGNALNRGSEWIEERLKPAKPAELSWEYLTSPEGIWRATGNAAGSMASIALPTLPFGGPIGTAARGLSALSRGAIGEGTAGMAIRGALTGIPEAGMEAGSYEKEALASGMNPEEARRRSWNVFAKNAAFLPASNAVQWGLMPKIFNKGSRVRSGVGNLLVQGYEEGMQRGFHDAEMPNAPYSYNPIDWFTDPKYAAQAQEAAEGVAGFALPTALGIGGGMLHDKYKEKNPPPEVSSPKINDNGSKWLGKTMDNNARGCVEAVLKIGNDIGSPFLQDQLKAKQFGVEGFYRAAQKDPRAQVIPFDESKVEAGDIIGWNSNGHHHVVIVGDNGVEAFGNSSRQNKIVHGDNYRTISWKDKPDFIIKPGYGETQAETKQETNKKTPYFEIDDNRTSRYSDARFVNMAERLAEEVRRQYPDASPNLAAYIYGQLYTESSPGVVNESPNDLNDKATAAKQNHNFAGLHGAAANYNFGTDENFMFGDAGYLKEFLLNPKKNHIKAIYAKSPAEFAKLLKQSGWYGAPESNYAAAVANGSKEFYNRGGREIFPDATAQQEKSRIVTAPSPQVAKRAKEIDDEDIQYGNSSDNEADKNKNVVNFLTDFASDYSPFFRRESEKGITNFQTLFNDARAENRIIPFDKSKLESGDIVYWVSNEGLTIPAIYSHEDSYYALDKSGYMFRSTIVAEEGTIKPQFIIKAGKVATPAGNNSSANNISVDDNSANVEETATPSRENYAIDNILRDLIFSGNREPVLNIEKNNKLTRAVYEDFIDFKKSSGESFFDRHPELFNQKTGEFKHSEANRKFIKSEFGDELADFGQKHLAERIKAIRELQTPSKAIDDFTTDELRTGIKEMLDSAAENGERERYVNLQEVLAENDEDLMRKYLQEINYQLPQEISVQREKTPIQQEEIPAAKITDFLPYRGGNYEISNDATQPQKSIPELQKDRQSLINQSVQLYNNFKAARIYDNPEATQRALEGQRAVSEALSRTNAQLKQAYNNLMRSLTPNAKGNNLEELIRTQEELSMRIENSNATIQQANTAGNSEGVDAELEKLQSLSANLDEVQNRIEDLVKTRDELAEKMETSNSNLMQSNESSDNTRAGEEFRNLRGLNANFDEVQSQINEQLSQLNRMRDDLTRRIENSNSAIQQAYASGDYSWANTESERLKSLNANLNDVQNKINQLQSPRQKIQTSAEDVRPAKTPQVNVEELIRTRDDLAKRIRNSNTVIQQANESANFVKAGTEYENLQSLNENFNEVQSQIDEQLSRLNSMRDDLARNISYSNSAIMLARENEDFARVNYETENLKKLNANLEDVQNQIKQLQPPQEEVRPQKNIQPSSIETRVAETLKLTGLENRRPKTDDSLGRTFGQRESDGTFTVYFGNEIEDENILRSLNDIAQATNGNLNAENKTFKFNNLEDVATFFKAARTAFYGPSDSSRRDNKRAVNLNGMTIPQGYRTETGKSLQESNPRDFIVDDNGNKNLGEINSAVEETTDGIVKAAPIRLQVGSRDFGYIHLTHGHLEDMKGKGFDDPISYVKNILQNVDRIYNRADVGRPDRFIIVNNGKENKSNNFMPVDLELEKGADDFYNIVTAYPNKAKKIEGVLIFDGSTGSSSVTATDSLVRLVDDKSGVNYQGTNAKTNTPSTENIPQSENNINEVLPETRKISGLRGNAATIVTDRGKEHQTNYRIIEADDLISSHKISGTLRNVERNENYPQELQPRDRNNRTAMNLQAVSMAQNLRPADLLDSRNLNQGSPVIREDGVVYNGNGRAMAISHAYEIGKADNYRDALINNAEKFGFSRDEISKMKQPVLVREIVSPVEEKDVEDITQSTTGGARLGASEQAQTDAKRISRRSLSMYVESDNEQRLGDLTTAENSDFVSSVLNDVVGANEINAYVDKDGKINQDGISRVKRALFSAAYGDEGLIARMAESSSDNVKNITNALINAAPVLSSLQKEMQNGSLYKYDLSDIPAAVQKLSSLRDEGKTVDTFLREQTFDFIEEDSAEMKEILSFLDKNKRSTKKISNFLTGIAEGIRAQGNPNQMSLNFDEEFETGQVPLMDIIKSARKKVEEPEIDMFAQEYENTNSAENNLFAQVDEKPAENQPTVTEPKTTENIKATPYGKFVIEKRDSDFNRKERESSLARLNEILLREQDSSYPHAAFDTKQNIEKLKAEKISDTFIVDVGDNLKNLGRKARTLLAKARQGKYVSYSRFEFNTPSAAQSFATAAEIADMPEGELKTAYEKARIADYPVLKNLIEGQEKLDTLKKLQTLNDRQLASTAMKNLIENYQGDNENLQRAKKIYSQFEKGESSENPRRVYNKVADLLYDENGASIPSTDNVRPARQDSASRENRVFDSVESASQDLIENFGGIRLKEKKTAEENTPSTEDDEISSDKFINVVDDSDEAIASYFEVLKKAANKISALPMFNPEVWTAGLKIGMAYVQRGINKFAAWTQEMLKTTGEEFRPWYSAWWEMLKTMPKIDKFNDKQISTIANNIGARYEDGITDFEEIRKDFAKLIGEEQTKNIEPLMRSTYAGIQKFFEENKKDAKEDEQNTSVKLPEGYKTESGRSLQDADVKEFIIKPDGSKDFGRIDEDIVTAANDKLREIRSTFVLKTAPIRLQVGMEDKADSEGFGYKHITDHLDDIQRRGFGNIPEYIDHILKNFNQIYKSNSEKNRIILYCKDDESKGLMPIDLELEKGDDDFYTIVTAYPRRRVRKEETLLVDTRPTNVSTDTVSVPHLKDSNDKNGVASQRDIAGSNAPSGENITQSENEGKEKDVDISKKIKKDLEELAQKSWDDKNFNGKVSFTPSKNFRDKVQELFGHDVDEVFITSADVRHIKNKHGEGESQRGQIDIKVENISEIYDVVNNFDEASKERDDKLGNQNIIVVRNNNGAEYAVLVERGKRKAQVKTFYKRKETSQMPDAKSPGLNVQNDSVKSLSEDRQMLNAKSPSSNVQNDSAVSSGENITQNENEGKGNLPTVKNSSNEEDLPVQSAQGTNTKNLREEDRQNERGELDESGRLDEGYKIRQPEIRETADEEIREQGSNSATEEVSGQKRRIGREFGESDNGTNAENTRSVSSNGATNTSERVGERDGVRGSESPVQSAESRGDNRSRNGVVGNVGKSVVEKTGQNFRIEEDSGIGEGGEKTKFKQNVEAIKLLKQLEREKRKATPNEQKILSRFNGWGSVASVFSDNEKWSKEKQQLKELLTEEEYRAASAAQTNAFYTDPKIAQGIWAGLSKVGFTGGRILDPSMGNGIFFGTMPAEIAAKSELTGIELDSLTGRIAQQLYQKAAVDVMGFEERRLPNNYFDLAITNVPFANVRIYADPDYRKQGYELHNFFFAKAIDKVRPGGLVAFITSTGTMQSRNGDAQRIRAEINGKADLIAAVKLPNNTFEKNAGTQVTTDVLILQKRLNPNKPSEYAQEWKNVGTIFVRGEQYGQNLPVNEYFVKHPENMLGTPIEDTLYGQDSGRLGLDGKNIDVVKEFAKLMEKLPEGIFAPVQNKNHDTLRSTFAAIADAGQLENSFTVQNEKAVQKIDGKLVEVPSKYQQIVKDFVKLSKSLNNILKAQLSPETSDAKLSSLRESLNKNYDDFVKKYGYVNATKNLSILHADPNYAKVAAIEKYKEDKKTKTVSASKADIFFKRTADPIIEPLTADSSNDALALSLSNRGRVDLSYMARLTGKNESDIIKELGDLIYKNPATNLQELAEEYLSGNVREKLQIAKEAAKTSPEFKRNVEALEKIQPADFSEKEITAQLGASWIGAEYHEDFIRHIIGDDWEGNVTYDGALGEWLVDGIRGNYTKNYYEWGVPQTKWRFVNLVEAAMNNRMPEVTNQGKVDPVKTAEVKEKIEKIKAEFSKWIWDDEERKTDLLQVYNAIFNNEVSREYDGSHLTFPGLAQNVKNKLYPHQRDVIWRMMQGKNTLVAHCVGAGKTWAMQVAAMEMKRLGQIKKPLFVVPPNILKQFEKEFLEAYPSANLLVLTADNLKESKIEIDFTENINTQKVVVSVAAKKDNKKVTVTAKKKDKKKETAAQKAARLAARRTALSQIATGDWDGIIISHDLFKRLPMSPQTYRKFYQEQIDLLENAKRKEYGDTFNDKRHQKALATAIANIQQRLARDIREEEKEIVIPFEELGIDQIFVDEADMFKNLGFQTKYANRRNRVVGVANHNSQRSLDMYLKTKYLTQMRNGGGVVFATGTPISNTLNEIYTMQRYLDAATLEETGGMFFDDWARTFCEEADDTEVSPDGNGFKTVTRLNLVNLQPLMKFFRKFADIKMEEDLPHLVRPALKNGEYTRVQIEPTEAFKEVKKELLERAELVRSGKIHPSVDNFLKIVTDYRKASLDVRLVNPSLSESEAGGKINAICDTVTAKYEETKDVKGTQLVFLDLSTPKGKKENAEDISDEDAAVEEETSQEELTIYDRIKTGLINRGIPANQIAFVHDAKNPNQRQDLFSRVNEGDIRVIIGSTGKMGAGTNFQKHLVALHHVDCPWRPRDIQQREGRILRKGNENAEVEIFTYTTKGSYDANMWEKVSKKASMIDSLMRGDPTINKMEDISKVSADYQEIAATAYENPLMAEESKLSAQVRRLKYSRSIFDRSQRENRRLLSKLNSEIPQLERQIKNLKADISEKQDTSGDNFRVKIGDKIYTKRPEAFAAFADFIKDFKNLSVTKIGEIGGFNIKARAENTQAMRGGILETISKSVILQLENHGVYYVDNSLAKMENFISHGGIEKMLEKSEANLYKNKKLAEGLKTQVDKPFEKQAELDEAEKKLEEIRAQIGKPQNKQSESNPESKDNPEKTKNPFAELEKTFAKIEVKETKNGSTFYYIDGKRVSSDKANDLYQKQTKQKADIIFDSFSESSGIPRYIPPSPDEKRYLPYISITFDVQGGITTYYEDFKTLKDAIQCARFIQKNYSDVIRTYGSNNEFGGLKVARSSEKVFTINTLTNEETAFTDEAKKIVAELDAKTNATDNSINAQSESNPENKDNQKTEERPYKLRSFDERREEFIKNFSKEEWDKRVSINAEWKSLQVDETLRERLKKSYPNVTEFIDYTFELAKGAEPAERHKKEVWGYAKRLLAGALAAESMNTPDENCDYISIILANLWKLSRQHKPMSKKSSEIQSRLEQLREESQSPNYSPQETYNKTVKLLGIDKTNKTKLSIGGNVDTRIKNIIDPENLTSFQKAVADFGEQMGVPVTFFKGDKKFHGAYSNGEIYLNANSATSHEWTFWHEAGHWMAKNNPALFDELKNNLGLTQKQIDDYRQGTGREDLSDDEIAEEIISDNMFDTVKRAGLLKDIGKKNKSLVQRIISWLKSVMDRFTDFFNTPKNGLTRDQKNKMYDAFGKMTRSIVDASGNPVFRFNNRTKNIELASGEQLPEVKFSINNDLEKIPVKVTGKEFGNYSNLKDLRQKAIEYYKENLQGTSVENKILGKIDIDKNGLVEFTGEGGKKVKNTSAQEQKLLLVKYLPDLIRDATEVKATEPRKDRHKDDLFYDMRAAAIIKGRVTPIHITLVKHNTRRIQFLNHVIIEKEDTPVNSAEPVSSNEALGLPPVGVSSIKNISQPENNSNSSDAKYSARDTANENQRLDDKYFRAVREFQNPKNDVEKQAAYQKLQEMVQEAAEKAGFENAVPEQTVAYKVRTTAAPKKTIKVYKVFTVAKDGSPTALFVGGTEKLPQGVWLDAQSAYHFTAKNGLDYVPSTRNPFGRGGKTGTSVEIPNEQVRQELIERGFLPKGSTATKVTALAYRPGWHAGTLPFFPQGGKKPPKGTKSNYENIHSYNQVVFECELAAEKNYTAEAEAQPKARNKDGSLNSRKADLQYMPENGFYYYATNPMTHGHPEMGMWVLSSSLKINRALTQEECDEILAANGKAPQEWEQGKLNLADLGYTGEQNDAARKTLAPITYDDNGNIIPLSQRFDAEKDDIRYSVDNSETLTQKIRNKFSYFISGQNNSNERTRKRITRKLKQLTGYKIAYGHLLGEEDAIVDHLNKVIRSKNAYDWENVLPKVGEVMAKQLNLSPTPEMHEYLASWLLDVEPNNSSPEAREFQRAMRDNPAVYEIMQGIQTEFQNFANMTPMERTSAKIVNELPEESTLNKILGGRFYEEFVDDLDPINRLVKEFEKKSGLKLKTSINPYELARLYKGSAGMAQVMLDGKDTAKVRTALKKAFPALNFDEFKPLAVILDEIGGKKELDNFQSYCVACQSKELHEANHELENEIAKLQREIEELKKDPSKNKSKIKNREDAIEKLNDKFFGTMMSEEDCDSIIRDYKEKFGDAQQDLVRLSRTALDILHENGIVGEEGYREMINKWKNYVPMHRIFDENEDLNFSDSLKHRKGSNRDIISPIQTIIRNTVEFIKRAERNKVKTSIAGIARCGGFGELIEEVSGKSPNDKTIITFLEDGKKKYIQTAPEIVRAVNNLQTATQAPWIIKMMTAATSVIRSIYTAVSPDFAAGNMFRDIPDAYLHNKLYGKNPLNALKVYLDTWHGLMSAIRKDETFYEWLAMGGAQSTLISPDRNYTQNLVDNLTKTRRERWLESGVKGFLGQVLDSLQSVSEYSEYATRIGTYTRTKEALEKQNGELKVTDLRQAALASRDTTIDFARGGHSSRAANRFIAFTNAAIQGLDRTYRTFNPEKLKTPEGRRELFGAAFRLGLTSILPTIICFALNHDDDWWKNLPDYQKENNWIIGEGFKIPKGMDFSIRLASKLTEGFLNSVIDNRPAELQKILPRKKDVMQNVIPTIALPILENYFNESIFMERPIVPVREQNLPAHMQYDGYTSAVAKYIGEKTGYSPRKIDHMITGYLGFLGRFAIKPFDATSETQQLNMTLQDMPIVRRFLFDPYKNPKIVQKYYEKLDEQEKFFNEYRITKEKPEDFNPALFNRLKNNRKVMQNISKRERAIINNPNIDADQRRQQLHELEKKRIEICERILR